MPLYFIAILAPDPVSRQVLEWKHYMLQRFNCQVALRSPAHITLIAPFTMQTEQEGELISTLQTIAPQLQPFPVQLKNFDAFKPRVIFVQVQPDERLLQLKKKVEDNLPGFPIKKDDRPFHPHITIANRDLGKKDFPKAWQHFRSIQYEALFNADNISLLRHNASHWDVLAQVKVN